MGKAMSLVYHAAAETNNDADTSQATEVTMLHYLPTQKHIPIQPKSRKPHPINLNLLLVMGSQNRILPSQTDNPCLSPNSDTLP